MKDLKIFTDNIEEQAVKDIEAFMSLPAFADSKVRIVPDVHAGKGCVIGFTATVKDKIIPNIVGVDIGCGMYCVELGKVELDLERLDAVIRKYVPHGNSVHVSGQNPSVRYCSRYWIEQMYCQKKLKNIEHLYNSIGTLGGGNHFIEIDVDDEGNNYLVIHTGSRNLGKQVCELYQDIAIKTCDNTAYYNDKIKDIVDICKRSGNTSLIPTMVKAAKDVQKMFAIPDELCYLSSDRFGMAEYLHDLNLCQKWAWWNRAMIAHYIWKHAICDKHHSELPGGFHTVHNYCEIGGEFESDLTTTKIIRKGAISAQKGEKVLIPMNMRDGSLICIGKGNEDWNCSAPHGAGRIMSRSKAKETLKLDDYKDSMNGIFTTSVSTDTIDEAPMVYKPMDEIISKIGDTVDILKIIKPIYNFKSSN